jgi:putative protease
VDGQRRELGDRAYLLSPEDLDASALVPDLIRAGVSSLKIEGRLKGPEYVAAVTRLYRTAVDSAGPPPEPLRDVALQMYSRGSGPGFLAGVNHQRLVEARGCDHRGLRVGTLREVRRRGPRSYAAVHLERPIARGDGLLLEGGYAGQGELGGRVWSLLQGGREVDRTSSRGEALIWFGPDVSVDSVTAGRRVFKTNDPHAERAARAPLPEPVPERLDLYVTGSAGQPLRVRAHSESGMEAEVATELPLQIAEKHELDQARLEAQLGRLGGTGFQLGTLHAHLARGCMLPISALNQARRALVERLQTPTERQLRAVATLDTAALVSPIEKPAPPAGLLVLCRNLAQARAALGAGADGVYLDFLELTGTGDALRTLRAEGARVIGVAPPRIRKPGEEKIDKYLSALDPDAVLIRGLGALHELDAGSRALHVGDFSLNVTNRLSASDVLGRGVAAFTPSFDLDATQLLALLDGNLAPYAEVVVHHPMPLFHMEHCVFAALLSTGTDYKTCGRPCDRHQLSLSDRAGMLHPVEADVGCRNTVFHAAAQSGADLVPKLAARGVRRFRVELVRESADETARIVKLYRGLIEGRDAPAQVRRQLNAIGAYGVVRGSLRVV